MVGISRTEDKGEGGRGGVEAGFERTFSSGLYHVVEGFTDGEMPARWEIRGGITCESINTDAGSHASVFRHTF